jgi:hypothetical protein
MAAHSPGDPLFPEKLPGVSEALPTSSLSVRGSVMHVGSGSYVMNSPIMITVPVERATYRSHDIPFVPLRTTREL